jgi:ABC-type multidrug transport system fused ATPase/permease subunit
MYFSWVTSLVSLGFERPLEQTDLEPLHPSDDPTKLDGLFHTAWAKQLKKPRPSFFVALVEAFGFDFFVGSVEKFVYDTQQFIGPFLLQRLIEFLDSQNKEEGNKKPLRAGYLLVFFLALNSVTQSVVLHQYFHHAMRTGMRLKSAIISAVYAKSLKVKPGAALAPAEPAKAKKPEAKKAAGDALVKESLGKEPTITSATTPLLSKEEKDVAAGKVAAEADGGDAKAKPAGGKGDDASADMATKKKTSGEVVNLMAVDAQRLQDTMSYLAILWSGLFQIAVSLWYLYSLLGVSVFAGVFVMVVAVPLTGRISLQSRALQKKVMNVKDSRIKVENEVLGGMKIIKLYA